MISPTASLKPASDNLYDDFNANICEINDTEAHVFGDIAVLLSTM